VIVYALLIQAIFLATLLPSDLGATDAESTTSDGPVEVEESGVMTHGTIHGISSGQIVVLSSCSREPIRYLHAEGTVYVDEFGDPVPFKIVKAGGAVIVFYSKTDDQRMANTVIVGEIQARR
jgi:hypothetical protein